MCVCLCVCVCVCVQVATDRAVEGGHTTWQVDTITPPALGANSTEEEEELKKGGGRA